MHWFHLIDAPFDDAPIGRIDQMPWFHLIDAPIGHIDQMVRRPAVGRAGLSAKILQKTDEKNRKNDCEKLNGQFNVTAEGKIFERSVFDDFWTYRPLDKSI